MCIYYYRFKTICPDVNYPLEFGTNEWGITTIQCSPQKIFKMLIFVSNNVLKILLSFYMHCYFLKNFLLRFSLNKNKVLWPLDKQEMHIEEQIPSLDTRGSQFQVFNYNYRAAQGKLKLKLKHLNPRCFNIARENTDHVSLFDGQVE